MIWRMKFLQNNIFSIVPHGDVQFDVAMLPMGK